MYLNIVFISKTNDTIKNELILEKWVLAGVRNLYFGLANIFKRTILDIKKSDMFKNCFHTCHNLRCHSKNDCINQHLSY